MNQPRYSSMNQPRYSSSFKSAPRRRSQIPTLIVVLLLMVLLYTGCLLYEWNSLQLFTKENTNYLNAQITLLETQDRELNQRIAEKKRLESTIGKCQLDLHATKGAFMCRQRDSECRSKLDLCRKDWEQVQRHIQAL